MKLQELQKEKLELIHWISKLQDNSVIKEIKEIMNNFKKSSLSKEQKDAIDEALISIERNGTISHNQVMEETKMRYPHLFKDNK